MPAGGYVIAMSLGAVLDHFANRPQQHVIALNTFFFKPTKGGAFVVEIRELKPSKFGYCVLEVTFQQPKDLTAPVPTHVNEYNPSEYVKKTHTIVTMGNMDKEKGTNYIHTPLAAKPPSLDAMEPNQADFMSEFIDLYQDMSTLPKGDKPGIPEVRHCVGFSDGRPIDFKSLAFWADMFIHPNYSLGEKILGGPRWCPTMQLEIQFKSVPKNVNKVLASFAVPHIINNRFDLDGALFDLQGNLLAITRHQCLLVPWERNSPSAAKNKL